MRAERLIQIVLLLQQRQQLSARELADALGVSRRTIFRDIEALDLLGIPVYAEPGSAGGYRLIEEYRSGLNALTPDERNALAAFSFPEALAALDIGQKLHMALLKLCAAEAPKERKIRLDWSPRESTTVPAPHLQSLYAAVMDDHILIIHYRLFGTVDIRKTIKPYGLVAKAGVWYLVYEGEGGLRHHRAADLIDVEILDQQFERPDDFDLERCWKLLNAGADEPGFCALVRLSPTAYRWLSHLLGASVPVVKLADEADGWVRLEMRFDNFEAARRHMLALGGAAEVLEPASLRRSIQDFAAQILGIYR